MCQYCGSNKELTFDHLLPRSKGAKQIGTMLLPPAPVVMFKKGGRLYENSGMVLTQRPYRPTTEDLL